MSDDVVLRVVQEAMGKSGTLDYVVVADKSALDARTVRGVDETTSVRTLRKIATGLGGKLVIKIEFNATIRRDKKDPT